MTSPFRGFGVILYKEFLVVLRDLRTLFFMFFPSLIEMIAFGYALDNDVKHMATVVLDEDRTAASRQLIQRFVNTETFHVVGEVQSVDELAAEIRRGHAYVGLQIPPNFTRNLRAGHNARVQMLIDGASSTIAGSALNTAVGIAFRESVVALLGETGRRDLPFEIRPQILYNPAMRSPNFFVPGVSGVVRQIATTFATAMSLVRERERGTLEQLLVSPLSRWGLMLGKLIPYLCIALFMATGLYTIMHWLFDVPIAGSFVALMGQRSFISSASSALGLLLSTRAQNQMQALQMSMVFIMPSVFFSGFIFPRETMPTIFWWAGAGLPTTYFIDIARALILWGASRTDFWPQLALLVGMGTSLFALCIFRFKQKIG